MRAITHRWSREVQPLLMMRFNLKKHQKCIKTSVNHKIMQIQTQMNNIYYTMSLFLSTNAKNTEAMYKMLCLFCGSITY